MDEASVKIDGVDGASTLGSALRTGGVDGRDNEGAGDGSEGAKEGSGEPSSEGGGAAGADSSAETIYSMDRLSNGACDKSRNSKVLDYSDMRAMSGAC